MALWLATTSPCPEFPFLSLKFVAYTIHFLTYIPFLLVFCCIIVYWFNGLHTILPPLPPGDYWHVCNQHIAPGQKNSLAKHWS